MRFDSLRLWHGSADMSLSRYQAEPICSTLLLSTANRSSASSATAQRSVRLKPRRPWLLEVGLARMPARQCGLDGMLKRFPARRALPLRQLAEFLRRAPGADLHFGLSIGFLNAVNGATKVITLPHGRTLHVTISPGIEDGQILRLRGKGAPSRGEGEAGDALVEISVEPHRFFHAARRRHLCRPADRSGRRGEIDPCRLTTNDGIQARVDELVSASAAQAGVTIDRIVAELAKIGFSGLRRVLIT